MRRLRVTPTPTGVVAIVGLVLFMLLAPEVADPTMAGFVWAALLGVLIVGAVWPCAAVLTVRVEPSADGFEPGRTTRPVRVGEAASVRLRVGGRLAEISLRWVDGTDVVAVGSGPAVDVDVPMTTVRRGRFDHLTVWVRSDAPFGMVTAARAVPIALPRPFEVGPRPIDVEHPAEPDSGAVGEMATATTGHGGDTTRSVRPYVPGDPAHLVHWPTSARVGSLVVREMEPPADRAVAVVVDLGPALTGGADLGGPGSRSSRDLPLMPTTPLADGTDRAVEGAVARAAALVADLRARGVRVLLCTAEPRPVVGDVGDESLVLSRLAAATLGEPGAVPAGWSVHRVTPRGDGG